jgi:hypothetical protein
LLAQLLVPSSDPVNPPPIAKMPLEETTSDPVISADPLNGNPPPDAATSAYDAVVAYEAVPVRSPTNDPLSVLTDPDATATNARTSIFD